MAVVKSTVRCEKPIERLILDYVLPWFGGVFIVLTEVRVAFVSGRANIVLRLEWTRV